MLSCIIIAVVKTLEFSSSINKLKAVSCGWRVIFVEIESEAQKSQTLV